MKSISAKIVSVSVASCILVAAIIGVTATLTSIDSSNRELAALDETLRSNFDITARLEVETVISMLEAFNSRYEKGELSFEDAKKQAADTVRSIRYNTEGYFWIDTAEGVSVVLPTDTEKKTEGKNRYESKDNKGNFYVHDFISNGLKDGGGYTDYWFIKLGGTEPMPKRSYTLAFKPFNWVVGTGNYIDDIEAAVSEEKDRLNDKMAKTLAIILALTLLSTVLAVLASLYLGFRISKPIKSVTGLLNKTAELDLSEDGRIIPLIDRKDETGVMAKALNGMQKSLRRMVTDIADISGNLASHSQELTASANENTRTIGQVAKTIGEIAESNSSLSANVRDTTATIADITKTISEVSVITEEGADYAARSLEMVKEGEKAVESQSDRMKENIEVSRQVGSSIQELNGMMHKIGNIVNVITSIAGQTNLLALNAAIEAARAGEAGKGFAVVSEEIRKLAEGSTSAAKEITQIINDTTGKTALVVQNMDNAYQIVSAQDEAISATKAAFRKIKESAEEIVNRTNVSDTSLKRLIAMSGEIDKKAREMAEASEGTAASMEEIAATSQQQLASVELIEQFSHELAKAAEELLSQVSSFNL